MNPLNTQNTTKVLLKNTGIIAIGQICTKAINFLLLPLYTNILSKEEYGLVDALTTYASFISVIVGLQLSSSAFRYLVTSREDKKKTQEICSTAFFIETLLCLAYLVLFLLFKDFITLEYKWFLLFYVISLIFLQFFSAVVRGLGNNKLYSLASFISALITLLLNVLVIAVLKLGIAAMLFAYIIGPVVGVVVLLMKGRIIQYFGIRFFSKRLTRTIFSYAIPMVPNELSWSLIHSSDRMIITSTLGVATNGLIAVSTKFSNIYTTFFSFFNTSWTEQVVLHYKDKGGPEYICRMFDRMVTLFGSFAIGIVTIMPFVYGVLIPNVEYVESYNLIPFYMIAVFFNVIIGLISSIYVVENETKMIAITTAIAALINILVDLLVINVIGMYAAPISSICGYVVISMWRIIDVNKRHCRICMKRNKVISLVVMLAIALISYWHDNLLLRLSSLVVVIAMTIVINHEVVSSSINFVTKRFDQNH